MTASGITSSSVKLAWNSQNGATSYTVHRADSSATQSTTATSLSVTGLTSRQTYRFWVTAHGAGGDPEPSNTVSVTTLPTYTYTFVSQTATNAEGSTADLGHVRPGQVITVTLKVTNTGTATWSPSGSNPVLLGTASPKDHVGVLQAPGWVSATRAARVGATVDTGGQATFTFPVKAPAAAGTVTEQYNLVAEGVSWFTGPGISVTLSVVPEVGMVIQPRTSLGQWVAAADGGVFAFAGATFYGSLGGRALNAPIVGIAASPAGAGYWLVGADGGVFSFGDAGFYGSMAGTALQRPVTGIAATPSGRGYWLVAGDGGVFAFGDARMLGNMVNKPLNGAIVGLAATPSGNGYWLAGADGGVFAFGDAVFAGSMGGNALNGPIVSIAATADGRGYWLAGSDGGVFAFGTAPFAGSLGGKTPQPVAGLARTGPGYALVDRGGLVTAFNTNGATAPRSKLYPGERLNPGEMLRSANARYTLVIQGRRQPRGVRRRPPGVGLGQPERQSLLPGQHLRGAERRQLRRLSAGARRRLGHGQQPGRRCAHAAGRPQHGRLRPGRRGVGVEHEGLTPAVEDRDGVTAATSTCRSRRRATCRCSGAPRYGRRHCEVGVVGVATEAVTGYHEVVPDGEDHAADADADLVRNR